MNYNTFLIRYGISPDNFKAVVAEPIKTSTGYMYCLEQRTDINRQCPFCDSKSIIIKDYDMIKNSEYKDFLSTFRLTSWFPGVKIKRSCGKFKAVNMGLITFD